MRVSKKLRWLIPYIKDASILVPEVENISRLLALNIDKTFKKCARSFASLTGYDNGEYVLSMYLDYLGKSKIHPEVEFKVERFSKLDILCHLAHEISHFKDWDHTPYRQMLEANLTMLFMVRLKNSRYVSEEKEFKNER